MALRTKPTWSQNVARPERGGGEREGDTKQGRQQGEVEREIQTARGIQGLYRGYIGILG